MSDVTRLHSEDRTRSIPVDGVRERDDGRLVVRLTRKRENHPAFDPAEDAAFEAILPAFVAWLEPPGGGFTQVVRLSSPKGADLRDVGKWAVEYAIVGAGALVGEQVAEQAVSSGRD